MAVSSCIWSVLHRAVCPQNSAMRVSCGTIHTRPELAVELVKLAERGCAALDAIREREATVEALHVGVHGLAECREGGVAPLEFSKDCWQFGGWRRGQFRGQLGGRRRGALQR